jgi:TRAP-type C4-dicarboxylate transport system substrate-binding protein
MAQLSAEQQTALNNAVGILQEQLQVLRTECMTAIQELQARLVEVIDNQSQTSKRADAAYTQMEETCRTIAISVEELLQPILTGSAA